MEAPWNLTRLADEEMAAKRSSAPVEVWGDWPNARSPQDVVIKPRFLIEARSISATGEIFFIMAASQLRAPKPHVNQSRSWRSLSKGGPWARSRSAQGTAKKRHALLRGPAVGSAWPLPHRTTTALFNWNSYWSRLLSCGAAPAASPRCFVFSKLRPSESLTSNLSNLSEAGRWS